MITRIAFVAATENEIKPLRDFLTTHAAPLSVNSFHYENSVIEIVITGIGILQTTYYLMHYLGHSKPDVWIQLGVGGAFDSSTHVGKVYQVKQEMLVEFGAEDQDGTILSHFILGWTNPDEYPYDKGWLQCPYRFNASIPTATGMTVFHTSGHETHIKAIAEHPHGQIENMEGVPFFYISLMHHIPFVSLRAISNQVEPRNKANWKMTEAIHALNQCVLERLQSADFSLQALIHGPQS